MKVEKEKFERLFRKMLEQPPQKRADAKIGRKKKAGKLIPPKPESGQQ